MPYPMVSSLVCVVCSNYCRCESHIDYGANVSHTPGLCLLYIGSALYIGHKIMPPRAYYFHIFTSSLKLGNSSYVNEN